MRTLRASEIGTYLYCQRAWWYQRKGYASENQAEMAAGHELHQRHGQAVTAAGCQRVLAYTALLAAIVLLTIYLTSLAL
jgi:hypothetical protein